MDAPRFHVQSKNPLATKHNCKTILWRHSDAVRIKNDPTSHPTLIV
jgi:hypothetical protein